MREWLRSKIREDEDRRTLPEIRRLWWIAIGVYGVFYALSVAMLVWTSSAYSAWELRWWIAFCSANFPLALCWFGWEVDRAYRKTKARKEGKTR